MRTIYVQGSRLRIGCYTTMLLVVSTVVTLGVIQNRRADRLGASTLQASAAMAQIHRGVHLSDAIDTLTAAHGFVRRASCSNMLLGDDTTVTQTMFFYGSEDVGTAGIVRVQAEGTRGRETVTHYGMVDSSDTGTVRWCLNAAVTPSD